MGNHKNGVTKVRVPAARGRLGSQGCRWGKWGITRYGEGTGLVVVGTEGIRNNQCTEGPTII